MTEKNHEFLAVLLLNLISRTALWVVAGLCFVAVCTLGTSIFLVVSYKTQMDNLVATGGSRVVKTTATQKPDGSVKTTTTYGKIAPKE